ncbi:MAG TPA: di-heme oxidoredictase family protein [Cyclobacteriaceae bacterium]
MQERTIISIAATLAVAIVVYSCIEPGTRMETPADEWMAGGSQTIFDKGVSAFSSPFPNLLNERPRVHAIGDGGFAASFVSAPAPVNPGLGPIFNNVSCVACHVNDGRGKPPLNGDQNSSLLIRLSVDGVGPHGGPNPAPGFGGQLQQRSIFGVTPEANFRIEYSEFFVDMNDGTKYSMQRPKYIIENSYIPLPAGLMISPRVAPPVFGLGLLEAVDDADILANADENDLDRNGISGKPNRVWDELKKKAVIGRFGWKANNPTLLQQSAAAYNEDMGITNFIFQKESSFGQSQGISDIKYDVTDSLLQCVSFYIRTLAVPARRNANDAQVIQGKAMFLRAGCASCHTPRLKTKTDVAFPEISGQTIFPYTDMLVHDMGEDLADNRPDFEASGSEWRTAPLWGIGLTRVVNGHNNFLHDGRARTLMEAILWHGGEAQKARDNVRAMSKQDRDALIKFLESL